MITKFSLSVLITVLLITGPVNAKESSKNSWQLTKHEEGIEVYIRNIPNSPLKMFKGIITVPATLSSLVTMLNDTKAMPRLLHNCIRAKKLKEAGPISTIHLVTKMVWPVKTRDSVVYSVFSQDKKTKKIVITVQAKPNYIPLTKGMVRVQHMSGAWVLMPVIKDGKQTANVKVSYELSINPGGNVPKWMVNALAVDFPFYTLKNLRNLIQLPAYKNAINKNIVN